MDEKSSEMDCKEIQAFIGRLTKLRVDVFMTNFNHLYSLMASFKAYGMALVDITMFKAGCHYGRRLHQEENGNRAGALTTSCELSYSNII
uniref:Uncharacterized protein n=1 Tax=Angiostrongylus cantonensis TaxID=6313 RepID=A0A0K0DGC5_ANGCA